MPALDRYREWEAPSALVHAVECLWTRDDGGEVGSRLVVPDNCADVILEIAPTREIVNAYVVGTMTRPLELAPAPLAYLGVRFSARVAGADTGGVWRRPP
ncbi:MAG: DUF6597 domain-containing transcriptional factor [Gemmatimonadaceae bacterium]